MAAVADDLFEEDDQFEKEVFPAELKEIEARRAKLAGGPSAGSPGAGLGEPGEASRDLVGLALSGGGIRCATLGLGVLQAFSQAGVLKLVDYLSTVSGGSCIGSTLSAALTSEGSGTEKDDFPLRFRPGEDDTPAVVHLRNSGNWIAPDGFLDKFRLAAVILRGILINMVLSMIYIAVLVVLTELAQELNVGEPVFKILLTATVALFAGLVLTFPFLSRLQLTRLSWDRRNTYEKVTSASLLVSLAMVATIPMWMLIGESELMTLEELQGIISGGLRNPFGLESSALGWGIIVASILALAITSRASKMVSEILGKVVLILLGVSGPAILFGIYFVMCVLQIDSPILRAGTIAAVSVDEEDVEELIQRIGQPQPGAASESEGSSSRVARFLTNWNWKRENWQIKTKTRTVTRELDLNGVSLFDKKERRALRRRDPWVWTLDSKTATETAIAPDKQWILRIEYDRRTDQLRFSHDYPRELMASIVSVGMRNEYEQRGLPRPDDSILKEDHNRWLLGSEENAAVADRSSLVLRSNGVLRFDPRPRHNLWDKNDPLFLIIWLALILAGSRVNVNLTSSHGFFRDRMTEAFLIREHDGKVWTADELNLRHLNPRRDGELIGTAPYHLINVALNLQGSTDKTLRGRNADFFIFSKLYSGGPHCGYCSTKTLESLDNHLNLGTAMAISGAGIAPNQGVETVGLLTFFLALFNIRLGYWLPNPRAVRKVDQEKAHGAKRRMSRLLRRLVERGVGLHYLFFEALGRIDDKRKFVNLSDGGHLENLAIYELLRRRCKLIIAVDAEEDVDYEFGGFIRMIRFARIDMGIEIEQIGTGGEAVSLLRPLRPTAPSEKRHGDRLCSPRHWTLARILYGDNEEENGYLLYIKSTITGDESEDVWSYALRNPTYPQETSADQFYSEEQFEAYRALGYHIGEHLVAELKLGPSASSSDEPVDFKSLAELIEAVEEAAERRQTAGEGFETATPPVLGKVPS